MRGVWSSTYIALQDLAARGMLPAGRGLSFGHKQDDLPEICREVTINSAVPQIRNHLTKRSTQDDIARRTGTSVVVRGRFMPPGTPAGEEKPLFLRVTPGLSQAEVTAPNCACLSCSIVLFVCTRELNNDLLTLTPTAAGSVCGACHGASSSIYKLCARGCSPMFLSLLAPPD